MTSEPARSESPSVFLARQPILGRDRERAGYELLFRDSRQATAAAFPSAATATAQVIVHAMLDMGTASVLGGVRGFVNCDHEMLSSEAIEVLSPEHFVLEVLETVPDWAVERCDELAKLGFELALDDYTPEDPRKDLLDICDYVKVDLPSVSSAHLPALIRDLRRGGKRIVAEKVETEEEFQRCRDLGVELYQGYYFAKPATLTGKAFEPNAAALLGVFRDLSRDANVDSLETHFKRHPTLGINLLRMVNTAGRATRTKIASLRHALVFLGRIQLRRWVLLMLYAGDRADIRSNPLLELAALRGRLLELLAPVCLNGQDASADGGDRAFLAGMLSLADSLLGGGLEEVLEQLGVEPEIREAVLARDGLLGSLLRAVESLENGRFVELSALLGDLGVSSEQLGRAQREAYLWIRSLEADVGPEDSDAS